MHTPTPEPDDRIMAHHTYLIIGVALTVAAVAMWAVQLATGPNPVINGLFELLRVAAVVAAVGYFVKRATYNVNQRIDHLEAAHNERQQEGYASGYVDGAAGGRRLSVVNNR